jgi:hypothetical protein
MTANPSGSGYWMVASDGGIFAFNVGFFGSMGGQPLNRPVVGMLRSDGGSGYRLVASDGGVFNFGDAVSYGSTGAWGGMPQMVGLSKRAAGKPGYIVVGADGRTWEFGPDVTLSAAGTSPACNVAGPSRPTPNGAYAFINTGSDGTPTRWSPCLPIHWQLSQSVDTPANVLPVLQTAFSKLSTATGLQFVYDGTTGERAAARRASPVYGDYSGKPVLVDFEASNGPDMCGNLGCTYPVYYPDFNLMVNATVVLNKTATLNWASVGSMGSVALHEFGHVVGLNHVSNSSMVMNATMAQAFSDYAPGDLDGLWWVSAGNVPLSPYLN